MKQKICGTIAEFPLDYEYVNRVSVFQIYFKSYLNLNSATTLDFVPGNSTKQ